MELVLIAPAIFASVTGIVLVTVCASEIYARLVTERRRKATYIETNDAINL